MVALTSSSVAMQLIALKYSSRGMASRLAAWCAMIAASARASSEGGGGFDRRGSGLVVVESRIGEVSGARAVGLQIRCANGESPAHEEGVELVRSR